MSKLKQLTQKEYKKQMSQAKQQTKQQTGVSFQLGSRAHDKYGNPVWS